MMDGTTGRGWMRIVLLGVMLLPLQVAASAKDKASLKEGEATPSGEIVQEAASFQQLCASNPYQSIYFDCSCLHDAFVLKRTELGLDVPQYQVVELLTKGPDAVCGNGPAIRQNEYDSCVADIDSGRLAESSVGQYNTTREELLDYCQCSSDLLAEKFSAAPKLSMSYISDTAVDARFVCIKPEDR